MNGATRNKCMITNKETNKQVRQQKTPHSSAFVAATHSDADEEHSNKQAGKETNSVKTKGTT
jgi:hypothetical protein